VYKYSVIIAARRIDNTMMGKLTVPQMGDQYRLFLNMCHLLIFLLLSQIIDTLLCMIKMEETNADNFSHDVH
jgi:hypothetical protein